MSMTGIEAIQAIEWRASDIYKEAFERDIAGQPAYIGKLLPDVQLVLEKTGPQPYTQDQLTIRAATPLDLQTLSLGTLRTAERIAERQERLQRVAALAVESADLDEILPGSLMVGHYYKNRGRLPRSEQIYGSRLSLGSLESILAFTKIIQAVPKAPGVEHLFTHEWRLRHRHDLPINGAEPPLFLQEHAAWLYQESSRVGIQRTLYGQTDPSGQPIPTARELIDRAETVNAFLAGPERLTS